MTFTAIPSRTGRAVCFFAPLALAAFLIAGCGGDDKKNPTSPGGGNDNPVVTQQMAGVWSVTMTLRDCTTNEVMFSDTYADTMCVGNSMGEVGSEAGGSCSVTQNGSTYTIDCTQTVPLEAGCNMLTHTHFTMTMGSTSYHGTGQVTGTLQPAGCIPGYQNSCMNMEINGTKTGPVPAGACQ